MRIAITGGSGTVGRAVISLALDLGHEIVNIDRVAPATAEDHARIAFVQAELTDYHAFEQALSGCDALIHLAAIPTPHKHPDHVVHNNNVVISYNALSAAAKMGIHHVCQASSVNAIGAVYSRWPRFDYFPLDEAHPTYNEEAYSLSKWICEQQGDAFARRYEHMCISSMRFHAVLPERPTSPATTADQADVSKDLWGYTHCDAAAHACLLALMAPWRGHQAFFIVASDTRMDVPSLDLARRFFPEVPVRGDLSGNRSSFNCHKAEQLLGWRHDQVGLG